MARSKFRDRTLKRLALVLLAFADDDDDDDELLALLLLLGTQRDTAEEALSRRWGPRGPYDRARVRDNFLTLMNPQAAGGFTERYFKSWLRVDRSSFKHLLSLIEDNPVFQSQGKKPQFPVEYQLAAFLLKWGQDTGVKVSTLIGISEGSVANFCDRVCVAFREIKHEHIWWPGPERRQFIKAEMGDMGFPGCIGVVDGTLFRLVSRPSENPYSYFSRKQFYAIAAQATTDHRGRFTSYDLNFAGSVPDVTMFKQSHLWNNLRLYFEDDEYVLADKGYPLSPYTIRPFAEPEFAKMDPGKVRLRRKWNKKLSSVRIAVEHAFGYLKGRFPMLRALPIIDLDKFAHELEALMVVHNILSTIGDDPNSIEGFNGIEDEEPVLQDPDEAIPRRRRRRGGDDSDGEIERVVDRRGHTRGDLSDRDLRALGLLRRKRLIDHWRQNYDIDD